MSAPLTQKDIDDVNISKKRVLIGAAIAFALIAAGGIFYCKLFAIFPDLDERDFVSDLCVKVKDDPAIHKILSTENNRLENVFWGYRQGRFAVSVWTSDQVNDTQVVSERIKEIKGGMSDDASPKIKEAALEWGVGREPYREQVYKTEILIFDR